MSDLTDFIAAFDRLPQGGYGGTFAGRRYRVTKTVDGETKSGIAVLMEMTRLEPDVPLDWLN